MPDIIRHGSVMQDAEYEGIMPPDIVDRLTVKHSVPMQENEDYQSGGSGGSGDAYEELLKSVIDRTVTSLKIPNGVTEIGGYAFYTCDDLRSVSLPDGLTHIGDYSFAYSNLGSMATLKIPDSVIHIAARAFANTKILNVVFKGKPNFIATTAFNSCSSLKTIKVPWAEGEVSNAPWGANSATIVYNYTGE